MLPRDGTGWSGTRCFAAREFRDGNCTDASLKSIPCPPSQRGDLKLQSNRKNKTKHTQKPKAKKNNTPWMKYIFLNTMTTHPSPRKAMEIHQGATRSHPTNRCKGKGEFLKDKLKLVMPPYRENTSKPSLCTTKKWVHSSSPSFFARAELQGADNGDFYPPKVKERAGSCK